MKNLRKFLILLSCFVISICLMIGGIGCFGLYSNKKVNEEETTDAFKTGQEYATGFVSTPFYNSSTKKWDKSQLSFILDKLSQGNSGSGAYLPLNLVSLTGNIDAATIRGNNAGKSIIVIIGGLKWIVVEVAVQESDASKLVLTLYLSNTSQLVGKSYDSGATWGSADTSWFAFSKSKCPGGYGCSVIRAVDLGNGGDYYDSSGNFVYKTTANSNNYFYSNVIWPLYNYLLGSNQIRTSTPFSFIVEANATTWTGTGKGFTDSLGNESIYSGWLDDYGDVCGWSDRWITDKLWLPTVTMTGFSSNGSAASEYNGINSATGTWRLNDYERSNDGYSWLRSSGNNGLGVFCLGKEGELQYRSSTQTNTGCRPAMYLDLSKIMAENNVTVTANGNGGTVTSNATQTFAINSFLPSLPSVSRPGYTFDGWYNQPTGGLKVGTGMSNNEYGVFNRDATIYAHWTPLLTIISKPGTQLQNLVGGSTGNYTVSGHNASIKLDAYGDVYTHTISTDNDPYVTIRETAYLQSGKEYTMHAEIASSGTASMQVFYGINSAYSEANSRRFTASTKDVKFTVPTTGTYNFRFDNDSHATMTISNFYITQGSASTSDITIERRDNSKYFHLVKPTRKGYSYTSWTTTNCSVYNNTVQITNTSLTASATVNWTANSYTILFNQNGGQDGSPLDTKAVFDSKPPNVTPPNRVGYTFLGYFDSPTGTTQYYDSSGKGIKTWDKDTTTTLYAHWRANSYTVNFETDNLAINPSTGLYYQTRAYGSTIKENSNNIDVTNGLYLSVTINSTSDNGSNHLSGFYFSIPTTVPAGQKYRWSLQIACDQAINLTNVGWEQLTTTSVTTKANDYTTLSYEGTSTGSPYHNFIIYAPYNTIPAGTVIIVQNLVIQKFEPDMSEKALPSKKFTFDQKYPSLPTPVRTGYTFLNWQGNLFNKDMAAYKTGQYIDGSGKYQTGGEYSVYKLGVNPNTSYTIINSGQSTAPGYAVYDINGKLLSSASYNNKATFTFTTPANAEYILVSVVTSSTSSRYDKEKFELRFQPKGGEAISLTSNTIFKPVWQVNSYTVKLYGNGGEFSSTDAEWTKSSNILLTQKVTYDKIFKLPTIIMSESTRLSRPGYLFKGWASNASATTPTLLDGQADLSKLNPTDNGFIHYYAVWESTWGIPISQYSTKQYFDGQKGVFTTHDEYSVFKLPVKAETSYRITNSGKSAAPGYAIYSSAGTVLAYNSYNNTAQVTLTTPKDAAYMLVSVVTNSTYRYDKDSFKVEKLEGSSITVARTGFAGKGTEKEPYQISSAEDLGLLASLVSYCSDSFSGKYFKQTANIDISSKTWLPIGFVRYFSGTYDGNGFYIQGLHTLNQKNAAGNQLYSNVGLFGWTDSGNLKNITLIRKADEKVIGYDSVGSIAGLANFGSITNCLSYAVVEGFSTVGMIGYTDSGNISACYNYGNISASNSSNSHASGALVGYSYGGRIANSYANCTVSGYNIGGLVGTLENGSELLSCGFEGTLSEKAGLLVCEIYNSTIKDCFVNAAGDLLGGIAVTFDGETMDNIILISLKRYTGSFSNWVYDASSGKLLPKGLAWLASGYQNVTTTLLNSLGYKAMR